MARLPDPSDFTLPDNREPYEDCYWCVKCRSWEAPVWRRAAPTIRGFQRGRLIIRKLACGHWREHHRLESDRRERIKVETKWASQERYERTVEDYA